MPKKTTAAIIEQQCDYVTGVKNNQPKLYKQVGQTMVDEKNYSSWFVTIENNKGRTEVRKVSVSNELNGISKEWIGLKQLIMVERTVKGKSRNSFEQAYYISSKKSNALEYMLGNWVSIGELKMGCTTSRMLPKNEDGSGIKCGAAPQNISTLKNISINLMRLQNFCNIASATRLLANNIPKKAKMIAYN